MWFIKFWIISTIISYGGILLCGKALMNSLYRKGYRFRKSTTTFSEQFMTFLKCCIPVFNILLLLVMILMKQETLEKEVLKKLTEQGLVKQPDEW
jgi:hypothetical protein